MNSKGHVKMLTVNLPFVSAQASSTICFSSMVLVPRRPPDAVRITLGLHA